MPRLRAILALGTIAHHAVLTARGFRRALFPFQHGRLHCLPCGLTLADSYHCSRLNTNTGKLSPAMFEAIFALLSRCLDAPQDGRGFPGTSVDLAIRP
jgi:uracil-DNA glycosylase